MILYLSHINKVFSFSLPFYFIVGVLYPCWFFFSSLPYTCHTSFYLLVRKNVKNSSIYNTRWSLGKFIKWYWSSFSISNNTIFEMDVTLHVGYYLTLILNYFFLFSHIFDYCTNNKGCDSADLYESFRNYLRNYLENLCQVN